MYFGRTAELQLDEDGRALRGEHRGGTHPYEVAHGGKAPVKSEKVKEGCRMVDGDEAMVGVS